MKKGFTLIELLAVIVILAIIALIATPIVLNIISDAKKSAVLRSAEFYLKGVEHSIATSILKNIQIEDGSYSIMNDGNICIGKFTNNTCTGDILKVEIDGEVPKEGTITIINGNISGLNVTISEKEITKNSKGELEYVKTLSDLAVKELGITSVASCATDGTKCDPGEAFAIKVNDDEIYKFRVLNDDGNKVTLIMSTNLGEPVAWSTKEECYVFETDFGEEGNTCDLANAYGPLTALEALKTRTSNWTNIAPYSYELDYGKVYFPSTNYEYFEGKYSDEFVQNVRARLPRLSDFTSEIGCNGAECPKWLIEDIIPFDETPDDEEFTDAIFWLSDVAPEENMWNEAYYAWGASNYEFTTIEYVIDISSEYYLIPVITITK